MQKVVIMLVAIAVFAAACGKDDFVNPEKTLFKRLARDGGVWEVEKIEEYSIANDGTETLDTTLYRDRQYVFYEHSEVFSYEEYFDLSYNAVAVLNKGQGGVRYAAYAEQERVIFEDYGVIVGPQITFTVRENKPSKQVWDVYENSPSKKRISVYLKHCPGCEPYYGPEFIGGI